MILKHTVNFVEAPHTAAMLGPPHRFKSRHTNIEAQAGITDPGSDDPTGTQTESLILFGCFCSLDQFSVVTLSRFSPVLNLFVFLGGFQTFWPLNSQSPLGP